MKYLRFWGVNAAQVGSYRRFLDSLALADDTDRLSLNVTLQTAKILTAIHSVPKFAF